VTTRHLILLLLGATLALSGGRAADKTGDFDGLTQWMEVFLSKHNVPGGAIAVTQGGRLVYAQGFGLANPATSENFEPDTLTRVGSLSKLVTSTALLKLMERGGLTPETKAFGTSGAIPFPVPGDADPRLADIQLRHLFTMSSGWKAAADTSGPFSALEILEKTGTPLPPQSDLLLEAMMAQPLAAVPGTDYDYLNISPMFLAKALSVKSGKPYDQQVVETILQPIGLRAPRVGLTRQADRQIGEATYDTSTELPSLYPGDGLVPLAYCYGVLDLQTIAPTGGWLFSAVDFAQLLAHISGERRPFLLNPASRAHLTTRPAGVQNWKDTAMFYGFHTEAFENGSVWGKYGSMPGVAAWAATLPNGLGVVIVLNGRDESAPEVYDPPFAGTTFDQEIRDGIQNALRDLPRVPGDLFRNRYPSGRPALTGAARAAGTVGVAFSHTLSALPKNAIINMPGGNIPGLRLNPLTGELRGTPKEAGRYLMPITATNLQGSANGLLEVIIGEPGTPVVSGDAYCPDKYQNVLREGRLVDEAVMLGSNLTVRARSGLGVRVVFLDPDGDLVAAEMQGPGTLTINLENAITKVRPNFPSRGDAEFVLAGTTGETTFRFYAIGKLNGSYPASGDGVATARRVVVNGTTMGKLFLGNTRLHASLDTSGVVAAGTSVDAIVVGELDAENTAVPSLLFAHAREVVFSGSRMLQANGKAVQVTGISAVETFFGADANGKVLAMQRPEARFVDDGVDITNKLFPPTK
jgi:CubicO group peptidase (beta-lactamase class C family)